MSRKDEIGALSQSFDQKAERIETLLMAERRLLQDVSHELRSPLARLRFALQLARTSPDPSSAFLRVDREVERLASLVSDLLQVTRAEGDPQSRNLETVQLGSLMQVLVDDCRIEAQASQVEIAFTPEEVPPMSGDRELLRRAIENLLRNAIQHAPAGSTIDIGLCRKESEVKISVRDRGSGVPENQLNKIFEPFYRTEEHRNGSNGGVGLGLAIAKRAVLAHTERIGAHNGNPGLQVEIFLPV